MLKAFRIAALLGFSTLLFILIAYLGYANNFFRFHARI